MSGYKNDALYDVYWIAASNAAEKYNQVIKYTLCGSLESAISVINKWKEELREIEKDNLFEGDTFACTPDFCIYIRELVLL